MNVLKRTVTIVVAVAFLCAACRTSQPAPTASQKAKQLPTGTLDQILAPIALYPDALLAQMLMSATEPAKVAELDKFIKSNSNKGTQLQDAAVKAGFDPSFVALVLFPDVVAMMAQQIAWTTLLGQAFTSDKTMVFASIQKWRMQAKNVGTLKDSPQQKVETKTTSKGEQVIVIEPANPQIIYVPQYNTEVVYTQPPSTNTTVVYTQAPSTSTTVIVQEDNDADVAVAAGLIGFTAGVAIGAMVSNNYYYAPYPYYGPRGWYGGAYMYNDAWDDYYDHREDAREDWMDHREDLADERTDRLEDRGEQRTDRQENRQENRPASQEQRTERQQTRQENRPQAGTQPTDRQQARQENRPQAGTQPTERQQTRQENRPEAQTQPTDRQQTRQETRPESQGQFSQRASDASAPGLSDQSVSTARGDRVGSSEARGYGNGSQSPSAASTQRTSGGGARSDAFSGYSSGSSQRAASSRGQASRSSSRGGGGGSRRR